MNIKKISGLILGSILLLVGISRANEIDTASSDSIVLDTSMFTLESLFASYVDSMEGTVQFLTGEVVLGDGEATITIPDGYRLLGPKDAKFIMEDQWNNPPNATLGLLIPPGQSPFSPVMSYAIDITYEEEGYVDDEDAAEINYDELLDELKEEAIEAAPELRKQGYQGYEIIGWAQEPYYDYDNKKLHWAKEARFDSAETNTLNYNIRILGRKGYLVMNVIGDMDALPDVQNHIDEILGSVEFNDGYRYDQFDSNIDKVAAYGIGGLIAGKVLAKAGFFVLLAKFWKFIAVGAIGLFALIRKHLFGGGGE
ncbi:MAG: DUF2167 domain-containing protein [Bacteroidia bacterium]